MENTIITTAKTTRTPRPLTAARKAYARMAYQNGIRVKDIAETLGVKESVVSWYVADLRNHRPRLTQEQIAAIPLLYQQGYTRTEIAQKFGVVTATISRHFPRRIQLDALLPHMQTMREMGLTNQQIAARLRVSSATVRSRIGKQPTAMSIRSKRAAGLARTIKRLTMAMPLEMFDPARTHSTAA